MISVFIFILTVLCVSNAKLGFGPGEQDWGYVTVRERAHMFWWLFYTTASNQPAERPLIIWLQGGPGGSSTGIGNFQEIGPLTLRKEDRSTAWTNFANVLFVDNPVGTGFSYVEDESLLAINNTQIAEDFTVVVKQFFDTHPEFLTVPYYIYGQSYGGKMAVDIALNIIEKGRSDAFPYSSNFKGIGLGDAWVSPMESLKSWSPYLFNLGFVDQYHADLLNIATGYGQKLYDAGLYDNVTNIFTATQYLVIRYAGRINFYNVMTKIDATKFRNEDHIDEDIPEFLPSQDAEDFTTLNNLMNNQVATALGVTRQWGAQREAVFGAVRADFMKSVAESVAKILDETNLTVTVYNGQLDLIVPTIGTEKWVENLNWSGSDSWKGATEGRTLFTVNGVVEGYEKIIGNLQFYWVNRAGHSVPSDNPNAMEYILRKATNDFET